MKTADMAVELVDVMGSDLAVVNAARVSFHKQSDWEIPPDDPEGKTLKKGDEKLIKYLADHNHWTPFAHCFISFRIKAPIFVARQLVKHQVGLVWNEVSRRYVDEEPEFWFPTEWRARPTGNMKQGSSSQIIEESIFGVFCGIPVYPMDLCRVSLDLYLDMIKKEVAPEMARMILPLNTMTEWIWSGSLYAMARVCILRRNPHAQQETARIAELIRDFLELYFPISTNALLTQSPGEQKL